MPAERFDASVDRPSDELWREADDIKKVEKQLVAVLEPREGGDPNYGAAIRKMNPRTFSNDHGWREILGELGKLGDAYAEYQQLGLTKYLQYLGTRQEILRLIYAIRHQREEAELGFADDPDPGNTTKETVIFDVMEAEDVRRLVNPFQRLAQGEATRLRLGRGQTIEILLAKHRFSLSHERDWVLTDTHGKRFMLQNGRNTVGRGRHNDIALGIDFRNVSRRHMIMEPADESAIWLIDLSSHGTFVPPENIDSG